MHDQSFIDFVNAYGQMFPPSLLYQPGTNFATWQKRFREKLDELRGPLPPRAKLSVTTIETVDLPKYVRHLVEIKVSDITTLPAWLLVPKGIPAGQQRPALLALHGHHKNGAQAVAGFDSDETRTNPENMYGHFAAESGYVVLVPAWWGWIGRSGHVANYTHGRDKCGTIQTAASMYGVNVLALHIQDAQAAVDALLARPDVDAARIGCMGNSYGGRTSMWVSAYEPRVRAVCAAGCANTFRERSLGLTSCGLQFFHGLMRFGDVAEVFSLIAPRALQLMCGAADSLLNDTDRDTMAATLRTAYAAAGHPDRFELKIHSGGHDLIWREAEPFFRKHLGG